VGGTGGGEEWKENEFDFVRLSKLVAAGCVLNSRF